VLLYAVANNVGEGLRIYIQLASYKAKMSRSNLMQYQLLETSSRNLNPSSRPKFSRQVLLTWSTDIDAVHPSCNITNTTCLSPEAWNRVPPKLSWRKRSHSFCSFLCDCPDFFSDLGVSIKLQTGDRVHDPASSI
jgi:hypothetical protein